MTATKTPEPETPKPCRFKLDIPTERSKKASKLEEFTWILYGPPKIGKSTLANHFGKSPFFIAAEESLKFLEVYRLPSKEDGALRSWKEFKRVCQAISEAIAEDRFPHDTIVIDTADVLLMFCTEYICAINEIKHPSDLPYGKGGALVTEEFSRVITKLTNLGKGMVFICHSKEKEMKIKNIESTKTTTSLSGGSGKFLSGLVDVIVYIGYDESDPGKRKIFLQGNEYLEAGGREKQLPASIPFDTEAEVYEQIKKHFKGEK